MQKMIAGLSTILIFLRAYHANFNDFDSALGMGNQKRVCHKGKVADATR